MLFTFLKIILLGLEVASDAAAAAVRSKRSHPEDKVNADEAVVAPIVKRCGQ